MPINHDFVSPRSDGPDPTQIQPSNWNEPHTLPTLDEIEPGISTTHRVVVDLTSEEILELGFDSETSEPFGVVEIVSAPGAGKVNVVVRVMALWIFNTAPYDNDRVGLSLESASSLQYYNFQTNGDITPNSESYETNLQVMAGEIFNNYYNESQHENQALVLVAWDND